MYNDFPIKSGFLSISVALQGNMPADQRTRHWRLLDMLGNKKDRPDLFIIQSRRSFRCIYNLLILFLLIVSPCIHNQCQSDNSVGNEYTEVLTDRSVTKQVLSCGWSYDEK